MLQLFAYFGRLKLLLHLPQVKHYHAPFRACASQSITSQESTTVIQMYKERKTDEAIADHLGSTATQVTTFLSQLRRRGLLTDRKQGLREAPLTTAEGQILQVARDQGKTWVECFTLCPTRKQSTLAEKFHTWRKTQNKTQSATLTNQAWSMDEDQDLLNLRDKQRLQWSPIASLMPFRSINSIKSRYRRISARASRSKVLRKTAWSVAEIEVLRSHMAAGTKREDIALSMGRSIDGVIRKTYCLKSEERLNFKNPPESAFWSAEEVVQLFEMKRRGVPSVDVAQALGRIIAAVCTKLSRIRKTDRNAMANTGMEGVCRSEGA